MSLFFFGTKENDPIKAIATGVNPKHKTPEADAPYGSAWYFYKNAY